RRRVVVSDEMLDLVQHVVTPIAASARQLRCTLLAATKPQVMTRSIASFVCAIASVLFLSPATAWSPPHSAGQNPVPVDLKQEIARVEAEVDKIFSDTLAELPSMPTDPGSRMKRMQTLGKLLLFDKQLSVNRNQACSFCHMPDVDFTGPISLLN